MILELSPVSDGSEIPHHSKTRLFIGIPIYRPSELNGMYGEDNEL